MSGTGAIRWGDISFSQNETTGRRRCGGRRRDLPRCRWAAAGPGGQHTDTPTDWRPPRGLRGMAAVPVGSGRTGRTTRRRTRPHISHAGPTGVEGAGGSGGHGRASRRGAKRSEAATRPAGPGRASSRRAELPINDPGPTGVEGAGGTCRRAGGRWRDLAGLRVDAPSEARGADGSRAGRRPPAHTAAGPSGARNTSSAASAARTCAERNPYRPRNALIAGISRTACTRPAR